MNAGILSTIEEDLDSILAELRKPAEWGGTGDLEKLTWLAGATAEYMYDGSFVSVGIFNLSAGVVNVAFTPSGGADANRALFTLSGRGFIVLPYRGSTVSVGGAAGGSALIVPFETPQPVNAGTF